VSNALWAATKLLPDIPDKLLKWAIWAATHQLRQRDISSQDVSNILWAVAQLQCRWAQQPQPPQQQQQELQPDQLRRPFLQPEQLNSLLHAAARHAADAKPQAISITLWAVAKLGAGVPDQPLRVLVDAFLDKIAYSSLQETSNVLWSLAVIQVAAEPAPAAAAEVRAPAQAAAEGDGAQLQQQQQQQPRQVPEYVVQTLVGHLLHELLLVPPGQLCSQVCGCIQGGSTRQTLSGRQYKSTL
jgi:hypothetical protein